MENQEEVQISSSLKFVVMNIKNIAPIHLDSDNYAIWKPQILKILSAHGFHRFLYSSTTPPSQSITQTNGSSSSNPLYSQWHLTDQILAAALCSTISASILPYIVNLQSTAEIWNVLETRFQSSNRSKVIQLKNTFHNISLKNLTMTQYLAEIKTLVDQIAAVGSSVDTEDIILYILNGLPISYQSFKTAIRTMLTPINLDQLYPLLLSEEINLASDASRNSTSSDPDMALYANKGKYRKSKNRNYTDTQNTSRSSSVASNDGRQYSAASSSSRPSSSTPVFCQICLKKGHSATSCWHRLNTQYVPSSRTALVTTSDNNHGNWLLYSGATLHLTNSMENLSLSNPYNGADNITVGDGRTVNIAHIGAGILPTPNRSQDEENSSARTVYQRSLPGSDYSYQG
ncbi:hypothetical protein KFK09_021029 [Dendrobium nobile]|uniref:Retrovirus-related Pol polyprotein from transposon TNT 1-94 n=1 Tax=Dendrobium nobile TaxID=94219 RepID=A0A8T3ANA1_DENNO|nr:hypothetical protein KFK09_021029 [Dendrobium nobile]